MRKKRIIPQELKAAVESYFSAISKLVPVYEDIPAEEYDKDGNTQLKKDYRGNQIYTREKVLNELGQPVMQRYYAIPPGITALCNSIGITRKVWETLAADPRYCDTTEKAEARIQEYLETELTTRTKGVYNIIYAMKYYYGTSEPAAKPEPPEKSEVEKLTLQEKLLYIDYIRKSHDKEDRYD